MFGFTLLLLSRFCCCRGVGFQLRVAVTLATATLDVLTLAFLSCKENTCYDSAHHTEKDTEIGQSKGFHMLLPPEIIHVKFSNININSPSNRICYR
eukprot:COSAG02_NODE_557_length_20379_cov_6.688215_4_plen_96_part_00